VRGRAPDPRERQILGDRCDDRDGAVGGNREDAVDAVPATHIRDGFDVREVDDLAEIRLEQTRCTLVAVDGHDAEPPGPRMLDRAALMTSGADEEDGLHARRC
jgi:hypothetical protein